MGHWKQFMESEYLGAWDLVDRNGNPCDVTDEIVKVTQGQVGSKKARKPIIFLRNAPHGKGLAANSTNCKTIAKLIGSNDPGEWVGKRITLYPTTTEMAGETVDCIRVRPRLPPQKPATGGQQQPKSPAPAELAREPGTEG